jgi:DNA-binding transcriptional MerR regulator
MSEHTISELSALTGLPVRTIRYYVAEGLIPSSGMEGPGTRYPASTLARLLLITKLKDAHQPLAEIRKRLRAMSDDEVRELARTPGAQGAAEPADSALDYIRSVLNEGKHRPDVESVEPPGPQLMIGFAVAEPGSPRRWAETVQSARETTPPWPVSSPEPAEPFERSRWEHVAITADIELHIRRPLSRRDIKMVERLLAFARQLQGEDAR